MSHASSESPSARNLALYPWYLGGVGFLAWMPVFFLYFSSRVTVSQVLSLEAVYYGTVVLLEVPSGYFADRFGCRTALRIAAVSLLSAYVVFVFGESFATLAVAQALLAAGLAFNSGTDTTFHLASLAGCGLQQEYADREASLSRLLFGVGGGAALLGGVAGAVDLKLAYVLASIGALVAVVASARFVGVQQKVSKTKAPFLRAFAYVREPVLRMAFLVVVVATLVNHLPYEFYQLYLAALDGDAGVDRATPVIAGLHVAVVMLVASSVAGRSVAWARRVGVWRFLLLSIALQFLMLALMAAIIHPVVALVLVLRSAPGAMQKAPIRGLVAPRVPPEHRATYLSFQSLSGRLAFTATLGVLSWTGSEELSVLLRWSALLAFVLLLLSALAAFVAPRRVGL